MKKIFKTFLIIICLLTTISLFTPTRTEATTNYDKKDLFTIIRTVENGRHYIYVLLGSLVISKCEEL